MAAPEELILTLRDELSSNLAFRDSANRLFEHIDNLNEPTIIIDFSGVESMTRSFAHQYILNKNKSIKHITERAMPFEIVPVFDLVERQRRERALDDQRSGS
jgi:anti-anti-sigma regulatory factor